MDLQSQLERLAGFVNELQPLFAADPLGAMLLSHRIGREARQLEAQVLETPDTPERQAQLRALKSYVGYGS